MNMRRHWWGVTCLVGFMAGCSSASDGATSASGGAHDDVGSSSEALTVSLQSPALSFDFLDLPSLPAGVAGGADVVFVGDPLNGRVPAYGRATGRTVGELPPPPNGFVIPFIMHSIGPNKVAVLDAGGLPQPVPLVPAHPKIYEYTYGYGLRGFSATLTRTVSFDAQTVGFPEDFVSLGDGKYLLSDAVIGKLLLSNPDGSVTKLLGPVDDDPSHALPIFSISPMPEITVNGLPFLFSSSVLPGISSLALRGDTLYFTSPSGNGLYSIPFSHLFDRRTPTQRTADAQLVSAKPANETIEELLGITFNPYNAIDQYLYAADTTQLRVIRIDVRTGRREVVADDPKLFDFPSSLAFLPPVIGVSPLVVVSNQQERTPLTNDAIREDMTRPPFVVSKVYAWTGPATPIAP